MNRKKAQQLIEFAIIVPILMMVLFIVIEMGSALNARATLGEGIKTALVKVNYLSNLDGDRSAKTSYVEAFIKNEIIRYMIQHNIPNTASISVKVKATDDYAVAMVNYQYNPYFLVPGMFGAGPSSITFSSSQSLNPHIFQDNVFPAVRALSSFDLSMFHTDGSGNPLETGALADPDPYKDTAAVGVYNVRTDAHGSRMAILLHFYGGIGTHPNFEYDYARIINWQGVDLLPPNLRINLKTGTLGVRSPYYNSGEWFDTMIPYVWVVSALGINHLFYVKHNSFEMLLEDDSRLYYKFRFNTADTFYNRNIRFCGATPSGGLCDGDHRGTATVNERALRMNPRLGSVTDDPSSGNNNYSFGTMEPILTPNDPTHYFQHVKTYFAHTDEDPGDTWLGWDSANWQDNYFAVIHSPYVFGLQKGTNDMANEVYHQDITDNTKNPFFEIYRYRFKLWETHNGGAGVPGAYAGVAPGGADDGNIDANLGAIWDGVETSVDNYYTMDIVDVYIDSDGDGIPDAWDRDPAYFDVNINGILDGNELNPSLFNTETNRCNDGVGEPLNYNPDPASCNHFPDIIEDGQLIGTHTVDVGADIAPYPYRASPGKPFYRAAPYGVSGGMLSNEPGTNIPSIQDMAEWYVYDPPTAGKALYYYDSSTGKYYRRHVTWWQEGIGGCSNPSGGKFSMDCVHERRKLKVNHTGTGLAKYIHGHGVGAGPDSIELDPSDELRFLHVNNVFSSASKVNRIPASVW